MSAPPAEGRLRYTTIAHGELEILDPLPAGAVAEALAGLALPDAPRILDLGCGKGALLAEAAALLGGGGLGIDLNPSFVAAGRALLARRGLGDRVALEVAEIRAEELGQRSTAERARPWAAGPGRAAAGGGGEAAGSVSPGPSSERSEARSDRGVLAAGAWDLVLCVGARPLGATLEENLAGLARLLKPRGAVLLGEGYWRRAPDPEYLAILGASPDELPTRAALDALTGPRGLRTRRVVEATLASWDAYEGAYLSNMLAYCDAHPADPDAAGFAARARRWHDAYVRWGRDTLGFALVLLR